MTSTTTRTVALILATLALTAPVASAMPVRDGDGASARAPVQDLRNPDQRTPGSPVPLKPYEPVQLTKPAPIAVDDGPSPLVFILPSIALVAMLGAAAIYMRSSRPARV
jgi:hypothetical protein